MKGNKTNNVDEFKKKYQIKMVLQKVSKTVLMWPSCRLCVWDI